MEGGVGGGRGAMEDDAGLRFVRVLKWRRARAAWSRKKSSRLIGYEFWSFLDCANVKFGNSSLRGALM